MDNLLWGGVIALISIGVFALVQKRMNQAHERAMLAAAERHDQRQGKDRERKLDLDSFNALTKVVDAGQPSPECKRAAFELIAYATNQGTPLYTMTVHDAHVEGRPLGAWEISARRID